ncbi:Uncharacterised protein [Mycobacteroides abscessus subsp. abscessus]|nr:Uncharacterised protein [Mycobacteroides abscessus subsp. abscessus]
MAPSSASTSGSTVTMTFANWPDPPVCFLWVNSTFSTFLRMVSR